MLYIVTGQPAVGKSTWTRAKAKQTKACLIDIDTVFEPVIEAGLSLAGLDRHDRDSATYKDAFREPVYNAMYQSARANLRQVPVVLCAPFTKELRDPEWNNKLIKQFECQVVIYWLSAPISQIRSQMEKRGSSRDRLKLEDWDAYQRYFVEETPECDYIHVDMSKKNGS
ncbi:AAA family ATPase [Salinimonas chungwhensis]|uniref:AAA family ATPase n=1 Tax=Salinimonas chungwhensis TaxID=265425 RepID=UPI0003776E3D|nr:AAA family ATPase [Salinimonas chungwhensis]